MRDNGMQSVCSGLGAYSREKGERIFHATEAIVKSRLETAEQLADRLKVKPDTVRGWGRKGLIPCVRITPKVIRYDPEEVVRTLTERQGTEE